MYAYWITVNYREAYGMYACNGFLFNHEIPRRGETFVTRKITRVTANIAQGLEQCLYMGNIDALRDWSDAKDYVRMQWMMLQQDTSDDFVIATEVPYSVRLFISWSATELGITLRYESEGLEERAIVDSVWGDDAPAVKVDDVVMRTDPPYFRPAEVETLLGSPAKAKDKLGLGAAVHHAGDVCRDGRQPPQGRAAASLAEGTRAGSADLARERIGTSARSTS
jgi:GDPmannose 4,6-dehydratase